MGHHRTCKNGLWKPIGVTISYLAVPFNVSFRARSFFVPNSRKMTTIRRFCCNDLLRFTSVNLDHLTETVSCSSFDDCNRSGFSDINILLFLWMRITVAVQYVILHDLFGKMARLFPRRRRPWQPDHGLQYALQPISLSLSLFSNFVYLFLTFLIIGSCYYSVCFRK